ncbi:hypothetical protein DFH06DRAFT_1145976 [Mycena polygramma]|nr:hypothetical protein DFH06DRAFT_1145976 [Mycena polygramma]
MEGEFESVAGKLAAPEPAAHVATEFGDAACICGNWIASSTAGAPGMGAFKGKNVEFGGPIQRCGINPHSHPQNQWHWFDRRRMYLAKMDLNKGTAVMEAFDRKARGTPGWDRTASTELARLTMSSDTSSSQSLFSDSYLGVFLSSVGKKENKGVTAEMEASRRTNPFRNLVVAGAAPRKAENDLGFDLKPEDKSEIKRESRLEQSRKVEDDGLGHAWIFMHPQARDDEEVGTFGVNPSTT